MCVRKNVHKLHQREMPIVIDSDMISLLLINLLGIFLPVTIRVKLFEQCSKLTFFALWDEAHYV